MPRSGHPGDRPPGEGVSVLLVSLPSLVVLVPLQRRHVQFGSRIHLVSPGSPVRPVQKAHRLRRARQDFGCSEACHPQERCSEACHPQEHSALLDALPSLRAPISRHAKSRNTGRGRFNVEAVFGQGSVTDVAAAGSGLHESIDGLCGLLDSKPVVVSRPRSPCGTPYLVMQAIRSQRGRIWN